MIEIILFFFFPQYSMKKTSMDKSSDPGGFMKILRNPGINCQHQVKYLNFLRETATFDLVTISIFRKIS